MLTRRGALSPNRPVVTRALPRRKARVRRSRVFCRPSVCSFSRRDAPSAKCQRAAAPSAFSTPIGFHFDREMLPRDARRT